MFDRKDLEAVSKAYSKGKAEGGLLLAYHKARCALLERHPELVGLSEETLTLRVSQVLATAILAHYLEM